MRGYRRSSQRAELDEQTDTAMGGDRRVCKAHLPVLRVYFLRLLISNLLLYHFSAGGFVIPTFLPSCVYVRFSYGVHRVATVPFDAVSSNGLAGYGCFFGRRQRS